MLDITLHRRDKDLALRLRSAPSTIFLLALEWRKFVALIRLKQRADHLQLNTPHDTTRNYAMIISYWVYSSRLMFESGLQAKAGRLPRSRLSLRWHLLSFDLAITRFWVAIRASQWETAQHFYKWMNHRDLHRGYNPAIGCIRHAALVLHVLIPSSVDEATLYGLLRTVEQGPTNDYVAHDVGVLRNLIQVPDPADSSSMANVVVNPKLLSVHKMPPRAFNHALNVSVVGQSGPVDRPTGLVDWTDTEHLAQLSEADKRGIKAFQAAHSLPESEFL